MMPSEAFTPSAASAHLVAPSASTRSTARPVEARSSKPDLLTADASKVTPLEFVRHSRNVFSPEPIPNAVDERAEAAREYIAAMWVAPDDEAVRHCIRTDFATKLREIDERYAVPHHRLHRVVVARAGVRL